MISRPFRNNNPGDLNYGAFTKKYGAVLETMPDGSKGRFAKFPTAAKGFAVLALLLAGPSYVSLSIKDAINKYAPGSENRTDQYIHFVCARVRIDPAVIISSLNAYQFIDLLKAITDFEGYGK